MIIWTVPTTVNVTTSRQILTVLSSSITERSSGNSSESYFSGLTIEQRSTELFTSVSIANGLATATSSATQPRFPTYSGQTTSAVTTIVPVVHGSLMSSTAPPTIDYYPEEFFSDYEELYPELINEVFADVFEVGGADFTLPSIYEVAATTTKTASSGATTFYTSTTTTPKTYWFYTTGVASRPSVEVVTSGTHTAMAAATIYQVDVGGTEEDSVIYYMENSYFSDPFNARFLAQTATRITVAPTAELIALGQVSYTGTTTITAATEATVSKTVTTFVRGIAELLLPTGSTGIRTSLATTSTSVVVNLNYSTSTSASGIGYTFTVKTSVSRGETVDRNTSLAKMSPGVLAVGANGGISEGSKYKFFLTGFDVNGSRGLTFTLNPPMNNISDLLRFWYTAQTSLGIRVFPPRSKSNEFNQGVQLNFIQVHGSSHTTTTSAGSVTMTSTAPPGVTWLSTNATVTSSVSLGVTTAFAIGTVTTLTGFVNTALQYRNPNNFSRSQSSTIPAHFGNGPFAENFTIVERAIINNANNVYSDMINSGTISFDGNDTSYSGGQSAAISRLTMVPRLEGGGWDIFNQQGRDKIWWLERRNEL